MNFYVSAILLGLGFSLLAMGIYITMRIFNIPDITTDGSFTLGGAVTAVLITGQAPLPLTFLLVFLAGAAAGSLTGIIHTKLKVNPLLAGILVMTALYSVNLGIMKRSTIPLMESGTVFSLFSFTDSQAPVLLIIVLVTWAFLTWLLKTDFGLAMRATGNNEQMVRAQGINTDRMKITGLALANGLVALSGFLITQVQGFADINMGLGIVILGLGSVMIGEIVMKAFHVNSIALHLAGVIAGSMIFRILLAFALTTGIDPVYLKLVVAVFVLVVVSLPNLKRA